MHRFYLPPDQCHASSLTLTDREAHHGLHVLRLRRGDPVTVLDGAGGEYLCQTAELARTTIGLTVRQMRSVPPLPYEVTLVQALLKGKMFDAIIQKATELGVSRIVPLLSDRVILQLDEQKSGTKTDHWRRTAIEAIKQCGSAWLPRIEPATAFRTLVGRGDKFDLSLIAALQSESRHPRAWFEAFRAEHRHLPRSVCLWVGPEGDFTPEEVEAAKLVNARPITLGRLVLRSETAAIYSLAIVNYELQWSGG